MHAECEDVSAGYEALREAIATKKATRKRGRGSPQMIAANVSDVEMSLIREQAGRGGYKSLAEYLRAVAIAPQAKYDTNAARIAKPLSDLAYRIARAINVLEKGDSDAVRGYLIAMRTTVAGALSTLRNEHDAEIRTRE